VPYPDDRSDEELELLNITREDPETVAETMRALDIEADARRQFLVGQMQNRAFRRWLMEQLTGFGTFENSFGAGPTGFPDHAATQFKMGMKAAGWHLWEIFDDAAPDLTSLMRREAGAAKSANPPTVRLVSPEDDGEPEIVG
jgi:hypothetical protein